MLLHVIIVHTNSDIKEPKTELDVILKESDDLSKTTLEKEDVCDQIVTRLASASEKV